MTGVEASLLKLGVKPLIQWMTRFSERNTDTFVRARDEMFREWVAELHQALSVLVPEWERRFTDLQDKIDNIAEDPQLLRLLDNFGYEASRETIDERRRLLAHAAAGAMMPELTIAQKARVERVLRELDPEDVVALHRIRSAADAVLRHKEWSTSGASADALVGSGCVRAFTPEVYDAVPVVVVTTLGSWILEMCNSYVLAAQPVPSSANAEPQEKGETWE